VFRDLIRLARAEMLWFFNDWKGGAEVLIPLLSAEEGKMAQCLSEHY